MCNFDLPLFTFIVSPADVIVILNDWRLQEIKVRAWLSDIVLVGLINNLEAEVVPRCR